MKTILKFFILLFVGMTIFSCNDMDDILPKSQNDHLMTKSITDIETFTKKIVYKGQVYTSICE